MVAYFCPPPLVAPDKIEVTDRKAPPRQRPLLITVERRQFLQQITIRNGGHDVGSHSGNKLLPGIANLLEIEQRRGDPTRARKSLGACAVTRDHARQSLDLGSESSVARRQLHETVTPPIARCARFAGACFRAGAFARIAPIGENFAGARHAILGGFVVGRAIVLPHGSNFTSPPELQMFMFCSFCQYEISCEALSRYNSTTGWPEFLYFWGHTATDGAMDKHVLSQWWHAPFTVAGVEYATAEHFMMAEKAKCFGDHDTLARILSAATAAEAKRLRRIVKGFNEAQWEPNRLDVAYRGNLAKYEHESALEYARKFQNLLDRLVQRTSDPT